MPGYARKDIVDPDEVGAYHCTSRCVRQAFLCGKGKGKGKGRRKRRREINRLKWFDVRVQQLLSVFLVDLLAYTFLDNHFHSILRIRPDLAEKLSDREVVRRSLMVSPYMMPDEIKLEEPDEAAIEEALKDPEYVLKWRKRLSSLSWFMKYWKEPIARRANLEDEVKGAFWDPRFHSVRLLDGVALLMGSIYVDLNEVRARKASTPETSENSTIFYRILAWQADQERRSLPSDKEARMNAESLEREPAPPWVAPINDASDNGTVSGTMTEEQPKPNGRRPSDSGFLPMTIEQYMQLVDWAGRSIQPGKRGAIPDELAPIMERLVSNLDAFLKAAQNFGKLFKRFCGTPESMAAHKAKIEAKRLRGLPAARQICGSK